MKRVVGVREPAAPKLGKNSFLEPVTDHTYRVVGGWANAFVFVPDLARNKAIIIDPGVTRSVKIAFMKRYLRRFVEAITSLGLDKVEIQRRLQERGSRIALLHAVKERV